MSSQVFCTDLVVRGYECGPARTVQLPTVLSYFEHGRWLWILEPALGLTEELRGGSFFVVHRATVALARTFGIGTRLTVRAALRSVGRVTCEVEQDLVREDGVLLARGWITAVWLGSDGTMKRVPPRTRAAVTDEVLVSSEAPSADRGPPSYLAPLEEVYTPVIERIVPREVPEDAVRRRYEVLRSDCDLHAHVNNAAYLRIFDDASGTPAIRADLEYRSQGSAGEVLELASWDVPSGGRAFALCRGAAVLCRAVLVA